MTSALRDTALPHEVIVAQAPRAPAAVTAAAQLLIDKKPAATTSKDPIVPPSGRRIEGFLASPIKPYQPALTSVATVSIEEDLAWSTHQNNSVLAAAAATLIDSDEAEIDWSDVARWLTDSAAHEPVTTPPSSPAETRREQQSLTQTTGVTRDDRQGLRPEVTQPAALRRPQLPPMQRARPIQRATLLPPRIRPLKL